MIEIKNASKWYGHVQVLNNCSTHVGKGEVVVVCGPSGSGKSTLIKCINGLEPIQKGDIHVDGVRVTDPKVNLNRLRSRVGMVFQHFELFPHRGAAAAGRDRALAGHGPHRHAVRRTHLGPRPRNGQ